MVKSMSSSKPAKKQAFGRHVHETQPQTFLEVLDQDKGPVPQAIRDLATKEAGPYSVASGPVEIPTRWYSDPALFPEEVENIWKKKWQMACRIEELHEVGDTFVYNVAGLSFVIVRASETEIKGFWNSCLHRGVPLRSTSGPCGGKLQCPFHGFTWSMQGKSTMIPHAEEFPQIDQENFSLPEIQVAVWKGFVFVNPDLEADSLEDHLGPIADGDVVWPYEVEVSIHAAKEFSGNWKAVQEAFMESYHVLTTHPQTIPFGSAEHCAEFGVSGNVSLGVLPIGLTSEYMNRTPDHQEVVSKMFDVWDDEAVPPPFIVPEGTEARDFITDFQRQMLRSKLGSVVDEKSQTEMVDVYNWAVFPNFHPFGLYNNPLFYTFRPHGADPEKTIMEVRLLKPVSADGQAGPAPERILLGEDEEFSSIEELGWFGAFISQDSSNMNNNIVGLRNSQTGILNLANKFESKIRHFYAVYEEAMDLSAADEVATLKARSKK